jgi:predicted nucleic acid-binding protein
VKAAPKIVVVDAAILISALMGRSGGVLEEAGRQIVLATTDRALQEAERRVALGLRRPELLTALDELAAEISVISVESVLPLISPAEAALRDAVPSRNGAVSGVHILALAWELDAEIWSHDRDFGGTGVASWSTINLVTALVDAPD